MKSYIFTMLAAFASSVSLGSVAPADLIVLTATEDTGLRGDNKNSVEGADEKLLTRQFDPSYALVKFDLSGITQPIGQATLRMEWHTSNVLNQGVGAYRFANAWTENTATWNNVNGGVDPGLAVSGAVLDGVNSPVIGSAVQGTFAEWDVTLAAQQWQSGALVNNGLLLRSAGGSQQLNFWSREGVAFGAAAPQLLVETVPEPGSFGAGLALLFAALAVRRACCGRV